MAYFPSDLPSLPLPTGIPSTPSLDDVKNELPQIDGSFYQLNLTVNSQNGGVIGRARTSFHYDVSVNWTRTEYQNLFSKITAQLTYDSNANPITFELFPSTNWYAVGLAPFQDKDGDWLPEGNYNFLIKTIDYALIGGVVVPTISDVRLNLPDSIATPPLPNPNVPSIPDVGSLPLPQAPQLPQLPQTPQTPNPSQLPQIPNQPPDLPQVKVPTINNQTISLQSYSPFDISVPKPKGPQDVVKNVKLNPTNFPPTNFAGNVLPQPVRIDINAPDTYIDLGATINILITANDFDRIKGTVNLTYKNNQNGESIKTLTTNGPDDTHDANQVGEGSININDVIVDQNKFQISFDGNEIFKKNKKVKTLETMSNQFVVNILKRPTVINIEFK